MMTSRLATLSLSSTLLSLAALPGCSEQRSEQRIEHDATFASATPEQIERVYAASSGLNMTIALFIADDLAGKNDPTGCPSIVTKGTVTTVTGGCTTEEARIEGKIVIRNLPNLDRVPDGPTEPGSVEFDLRGTGPDGEYGALEGSLRIDLDSGMSGDLTFTDNGVASRSRLGFEFGSDRPRVIAPDSEMETSEVGGASVEGTFTLEDPSGRLIVRGADELVFDLAGETADGCIPYEAGENRGKVCDTSFEPRRAASLDPQVLAAPLLSRMLLQAKR